MNILYAVQLEFFPNGGFQGPGSGIFADPSVNAQSKFQELFSLIIGVMTIIAGIWFIFVLLIGAIGWLSAGGDKGAVETARKRISNGLTGLIIVVIAIFLVDLVGSFLGFEILDIAGFLNNL